MLLEVAVVSVIIGLLFKGSFRNLAEVDVRGPLLATLAVVMQYGSQRLLDAGLTQMNQWGPLVYVPSFLLLFVVIWQNRRSPAMLLIGFGILLNAIVITVNGGKMPVSGDVLAEAGLAHLIPPLLDGVVTHQLLTPETQLAFLGDIYVVSPPYGNPRVFSVGDMILALGAVWFIVGGMTAHPSVTGKKRVVEVRRVTYIP